MCLGSPHAVNSFSSSSGMPLGWKIDFTVNSAAFLLQEFASTLLHIIEGKLHKPVQWQAIVSTMYPKKAIVCIKECVFLALAEIRRGKTLWSGPFLDLYTMRQSKFLNTSAALPCTSPLPLSPRRQFFRAFAPVQQLLTNPAPFCFNPLLLTRGNQTSKKPSNLFSSK